MTTKGRRKGTGTARASAAQKPRAAKKGAPAAPAGGKARKPRAPSKTKRESARALEMEEQESVRALEPEVLSADSGADPEPDTDSGADPEPDTGTGAPEEIGDDPAQLAREGDSAAAPEESDDVRLPVDDVRLPVPVGRDLAYADALQRYMAEVSRHPLLTREEEHALAARFRETQDPDIAYRLVTANLRLVVKIAHEYRRAAFSVLDLIQEGNVGLMQAVQKYDPFRGVKLSSYAAWWIRAYILRYLMDNWRMVKLGTTQAQRKLFFNLRKEQEKLLAQGFDAAPKLLAEKLDVSEQDVREMDQRLGNDEFSLDTPLAGADDSRQTYLDKLGDGARAADDQLADEELRRIFKEKLAEFGRTLTGEKDRFLFEHRIAVAEGQEPLTLQQVGAKYGFTRERARQLEARLTGQLRDFLREQLPDFAQLSFNEPDEERDS